MVKVLAELSTFTSDFAKDICVKPNLSLSKLNYIKTKLEPDRNRRFMSVPVETGVNKETLFVLDTIYHFHIKALTRKNPNAESDSEHKIIYVAL